MPLHHLALPVTSNETSIPFYTAALAPLSYTIIAQYPSRTTKTPNAITGLGPKAADGGHSFADFWLVEADHPNMVASKDSTGKSAVHVAFEAKDRETVRKFYEEAMKAGGTCNGPPGVRKHYSPNYYGAFVLDPDGNNVEAVCMVPVEEEEEEK